MDILFRGIIVFFTLSIFSACTTYTGDKLLRLPEQSRTDGENKTISNAKGGVSEILDNLGVSKETKTSFEKISPKSLIHDSEPLKLNLVDKKLVVTGADTNIAFANNSIIISTGYLHISHSGNNIVICGSDVDISHDGSLGNGSLVISKGKIKISHATNTLVYAIKGVEISHALNVCAFNTPMRKTSWGHINNILVKPLFHEETAPNKSLQPTPKSGATELNRYHLVFKQIN